MTGTLHELPQTRGDAAQPYDQEFGRLRAEGNPKLGCEVYRPAGCLDLHLEGLATPFSQSVWPRVHSLRFALHEGDAAVDACQAAVQAQGLEVQLDGRTITVPVQPVAARAGQATRAGEAAQARWQGGDASATRVLKAGRPISTAAADSSSWEAAAGLDCAEV
ncbi:hypothetical protein N2152v2_009644 [Parachlorella kessleri]